MVELLKKIPRGPIVASVSLLLLGAIIWFVRDSNVAVFNPKGPVAKEQFDLVVFASLLMLGIVLAVFTMTFYIVWKYRAGNKKAKYQPEYDRSNVAEAIWWLVPFAIITVLSVVIWRTSHSLDPYRQLASDKKPLTVQVIALDWKWLFIYPEQGIATVNYLQIPVDTPINFRLTADAPMNSFWIPQLGGQVYAMAGMETKLHLEASEPGRYQGSSANISGEGFSGMKFTAEAVAQNEFDNWVESAKKLPNALTKSAYDELAKPSRDNPVALYASSERSLYDTVIMKYMMPKTKDKAGTDAEHHEGHDMPQTHHDHGNPGGGH